MKLPVALDQAFAYAHGRIGTLQQDLLSRTDVDRLLGTHDLAEAERALTEVKLSAHINQGLHTADDILHATATWVKQEVDNMAPESKKAVFQILWLEGDKPLIAYLLKNSLNLTSAISQQPESTLTAFSPEDLRLLIEEKQETTLPQSLVALVRDVQNTPEMTAAQIDSRTAKWVATMQVTLAKQSGSKGIKKYVAHNIDLQNIRTSLRLQDADNELRQAELLEGGTIATSVFLGTTEDIAAAIDVSDLGNNLADAVRKSSDDVSALESALTDVLAEDIARLWNIPLSIEPLFAFAALTLSQLRLLRVLLIGKRSGLSPQDIKKILPPFIPATHYVLS